VCYFLSHQLRIRSDIYLLKWEPMQVQPWKTDWVMRRLLARLRQFWSIVFLTRRLTSMMQYIDFRCDRHHLFCSLSHSAPSDKIPWRPGETPYRNIGSEGQQRRRGFRLWSACDSTLPWCCLSGNIEAVGIHILLAALLTDIPCSQVPSTRNKQSNVRYVDCIGFRLPLIIS